MTHYHFIGIGGTGLAPIAHILIERGHEVSGSDSQLSLLAQEIISLGGNVHIGHSAANISGADIVIRSSAIHDDNVEYQAARKAGIRVLKRSEFLSELIDGKKCLAVAGTHGKTTTTAMLAWVLTCLQKDPSYVIGGTSLNLATNAHDGKGNFFVIEADEYDNMFLGLHPNLAIVTYMEHDHPDFYPTMEEYRHSFEQFTAQVQAGGNLITCADNAASAGLCTCTGQSTGCHLFGRSNKAEYQAKDVRLNAQHCFDFSVARQTKRSIERLVRVSLSIPGEHNILNALAVLAAIHVLGLPMKPAAKALKEFKGTGRRFEVIGMAGGVTVIDDYAHHPTEISSTLAAARQRYPGKRIWAVWQPHTYSRTKALEQDFLTCFRSADELIITEVYAARESDDAYTARSIVEKMSSDHVRFIPRLPEVSKLLVKQLTAGDVLIVLSAGDANHVSAEVLRSLDRKEKK
jgi:UDP-N-acetylmuramate--alanine ligase